jgi:alpha-beta hydrolase superfamily lysophospholipase
MPRRAQPWLRKITALSTALAVAIILENAGCARAPAIANPWRKVTGSLSGRKPGTILRLERIAGAPNHALAFRILYVSTSLDGKPIQVSGVLVTPDDQPPRGGRKIVAWAHGTTGVSESCAPSLRPNPFRWMPGLESFLAEGYVVVATDYPGLGTPGPHPYLVGISEARAVLDSVRAARQLLAAAAGSEFAAWGASQGGHAALFTGQLTESYAPELKLLGVAVADPATDLATLLNDDIGSPVGKIITAYTTWSWSQVYHTPLASIVVPGAVPVVDRIAGDCAETFGEVYRITVDLRPLRNGFLTANFGSAQPWQELLERNTPGRISAGAPLLISQGQADVIVRPAVTADFVRKLRKQGETVEFVKILKTGHIQSAKATAPTAVRWIKDRFLKKTATNEDLVVSP